MTQCSSLQKLHSWVKSISIGIDAYNWPCIYLVSHQCQSLQYHTQLSYWACPADHLKWSESSYSGLHLSVTALVGPKVMLTFIHSVSTVSWAFTCKCTMLNSFLYSLLPCMLVQNSGHDTNLCLHLKSDYPGRIKIEQKSSEVRFRSLVFSPRVFECVLMALN